MRLRRWLRIIQLSHDLAQSLQGLFGFALPAQGHEVIGGWDFKAQRVRGLRCERQGAIVPQPRGGSRWPRTIRIRQDASVTTTEPVIAVARDPVIDRVADHPWDEVEDPCPLPTRKLARNAQRGFGFYIGLAGRHERKGIWAIRIDAELLSERTSLGQLDGNEAKIAAAITFADEAAAARA